MTSADYTCGGRLNDLAAKVRRQMARSGFSAGWHNVAEKLLLIHSEVSEACEAWRDISSDGLTALLDGREPPERDLEAVFGLEEELADVIIRTLDLAAALGVDVEHEIESKMAANEVRPIRHGRQR